MQPLEEQAAQRHLIELKKACAHISYFKDWIINQKKKKCGFTLTNTQISTFDL